MSAGYAVNGSGREYPENGQETATEELIVPVTRVVVQPIGRRANVPGGTSYSVNCYGNALRAQRDFQAKEKAEGKDAKAQAADMQAAMASGKLQAPPTGTAMYSLSGKTKESARGMWVVLVPGMTAESTGLPTQPTANGTPWLMRAGTPGAHIHIPQAPPAG